MPAKLCSEPETCGIPATTDSTTTRASKARGRRIARGAGSVPDEIANDPELKAAVAALLPAAYDFEVPRTVQKLRQCGALRLGLQMPEGLQQYATDLGDILRRFCPSVCCVTVFADATFGACCIDDLGARALGVDYLVHYAHSCLVPVDQTTVTVLYISVKVRFDVDHLVATIRHNFGAERRIALLGTVQFADGLNEAAKALVRAAEEASVPQVRPLSPGEVLGCTSPLIPNSDTLVFVCDGRFHLESTMIQNPHLRESTYRYDPFAKTLTREGLALDVLHAGRRDAIEAARGAKLVGLILGTLGRQGSGGVLEGVERLLDERSVQHVTVLMSEISPERLTRFSGVDAWVQVACPRLSIDWGDAYSKPLLSSYEAHVAFGTEEYKDACPMDYYSNKGGPWSNYGAHKGHGGSLSMKFQHLSRLRRVPISYEEGLAPSRALA
eukprot:NODE_6532_length_1663_cov_9.264323.p1 GENE.NODE_6532_length_1663_cov_9.264323~~NODE_6532_length_1663_cov_9.264323.p1  ORF type:complete len:441 (-),score=97.36 NODE_6532_length_1663_cov_9.264323:267-1589(-)